MKHRNEYLVDNKEVMITTKLVLIFSPLPKPYRPNIHIDAWDCALEYLYARDIFTYDPPFTI